MPPKKAKPRAKSECFGCKRLRVSSYTDWLGRPLCWNCKYKGSVGMQQCSVCLEFRQLRGQRCETCKREARRRGLCPGCGRVAVLERSGRCCWCEHRRALEETGKVHEKWPSTEEAFRGVCGACASLAVWARVDFWIVPRGPCLLLVARFLFWTELGVLAGLCRVEDWPPPGGAPVLFLTAAVPHLGGPPRLCVALGATLSRRGLARAVLLQRCRAALVAVGLVARAPRSVTAGPDSLVFRACFYPPP